MNGPADDAMPDTPAAVLAFARARRRAADRAEAELLQAAVQWATMHPAESIHEAETISLRSFGDTGIPVAGAGAPLVAEFAVAEFSAAVGLAPEAGKRYVGHAVELRYRLPRVWRRVVDHDLPAWKARRIADQTLHLSQEAAAHVDRQVAGVAHRVRPAQLDRLVDEAVARHMPERAEEQRRLAADGRHFTVDAHGVSFAGTATVSGEIDLLDALDLDRAVGAEARALADLGSTESLDVRRAMAIGAIARRDLTLELTTRGATDAPSARRARRAREVVLHVHVSEAAIRSLPGGEIARVENNRSLVTAEQVRAWCGHPATHLVVKPVVDLADHVHVGAYEVPDRVAERVALRDHTCVFPWCTRPARSLRPDRHSCDQDHALPYASGGPTCTCQIAPLCRTHHRLKTHGGWRYLVLHPGAYLWTSPHGYQFVRDHGGTLDVSRERPLCHPPPPPPDPPPPEH